MPKRIWRNQFSTYVNLIAAPFLVLAVLLLAKPDWLLPYLVKPESFSFYESLPAIAFLMRIGGLGLLFPTISLFTMKGQPNTFREFAFWQSLYLFFFSAALFAGPFYFGLRWFVYIPATIALIGSLFLIAFASRNLLVRE